MIKNYDDFEVIITKQGNQLYANLGDAPGDRNLTRKIPITLPDDQANWSEARQGRKSRTELAVLGQRLFQALITGELAQNWYASLGEVRQRPGTGLRLRFSTQSDVLTQVPLELLCERIDPIREFLGLHLLTPIVRSPLTGKPVQERDSPLPLRMLVVIANPKLQEVIDPAAEKTSLEQALTDVLQTGILTIDYLGPSGDPQADYTTLHQTLAQADFDYDIVHFIGHGALSDDTQEGILLLVDSQNGRRRDLYASDLAYLLEPNGVRVAVLQACDSARAGTYNTFQGVAQRLIAAGLPAAVAMQCSVDKDVATRFFGQFYRFWLAEGGLPIERAVTEARLAIHHQFRERTSAWWTPVLFIRVPGTQVLRADIKKQSFRTQLQPDLSEALLELGQADEAVIELEQAYKLGQEEASSLLIRALVTQAKALEETGNEEGALAACERVLQISPDEQQAQEIRNAIWIRQGNIAMERGDVDAALTAYQQAGAKGWEDAIPHVQHALEKAPDLFYTRQHLGKVLLELGHINEAVAEMDQAYKLKQGEGRAPLVRALLVQAKALEEAREEEGALTACKRVLGLSPNNQEARAMRTAIWVRRGNAALAREELEIALAAYKHAGVKPKIEEVEKRQRRKNYQTLEAEAAEYTKAEKWPKVIDIYEQLLSETTDQKLQDKWRALLKDAQEKAEASSEELGDWLPGHILDRKYKIVKQLATTKRSETYQAQELQPPHHTLVVKRLKRDRVYDADARGRFEREIIVLRLIRHQSVLPLYDSKTIDQDYYFVTEFADRGTLKEYLATRPSRKLRPIVAVEIALSVCRGLEALHQQGIINRDVKPGNILLFSRRDGSIVAKLADFSIARLPKELRDETLTRTGSFVGTLSYASPEQLQGDVADHRSDLYSWAITFFEMLTGESPTDSIKDPLTLHLTSEEFPTSFFTEKGVPDELIQVLQKNLSKDRELRYSSAAELREVLEAIKSRLTTDIEQRLSAGEQRIRSGEWNAANAEFRQGIALCGWYGETVELRGRVKELAQRLRMGRLCAQGMVHLAEGQWQEAIDALEPLRTLDPYYLDLGIVTQLKIAQSERAREQTYQLLLYHQQHENWEEILRLTTGLTTSYSGSPEGKTVGEIRKIALYARGKILMDENEWENAYYQLHRLYERDPGYEDVTELCATLAFQNGVREDIPASWEHQVKWLEKALAIDPNHRDGRTRQQIDRARHRWAEELLGKKQ